MKKYLAIIAAASTMSFGTVAAHANGWGSSYNGNNNYSSGLINVSPTVRTGNIGLLNNIGVLNNSPILSGNGILSGNNTGIGVIGGGNGLLNNVLTGGGRDQGNSRLRRR
jgi:hypothetical protein